MKAFGTTLTTPVLLSGSMWVLLWGGLNADRGPESIAFRAWFPAIAAALAVVALVARRAKSPPLPVGLLLGYAVVGILASVVSSRDITVSLTWGIAFLAVPLAVWVASEGGAAAYRALLFFNLVIALCLTLAFIAFTLVELDLVARLSGGIDRLSFWEVSAGLGPLRANSNGVARFLSVTAILASAYLLAAEGRMRRVFLVGILPPLAIVLFLLMSRASLIGLVLAVGTLTSILRGRRGFFVFTGVVAGCVLLASPFLFDYAFRGLGVSNLLTASSRTPIWGAAWDVFAARPILGSGFHADRLLLDGQHVHNAWLHALVQAGLAGALLFALAWVVGARSAVALAGRASLAPKKRLPMALAAALVVFLAVRSLFESTGAYFGVDLLLLAPALAYLVALDREGARADRPADAVAPFKLLGTRVHATTLDAALARVEENIKLDRQDHTCLCTVNMVMTARRDPALRASLDRAGLVLCDGMPLARLARGVTPHAERIRGTDFSWALAELAARRGYKIHLYGGAEGVADRMASAFRARHPAIQVVGTRSPPFRPLTPAEDEADVDAINAASPDIILVGLGCPKQEKWAAAHLGRVKAPVIVSVGAAFDFIAGTKKDAPPILRNNFEALWRFATEPQRLWRRVVIEGPAFFALLAAERITGRHKEGR